MDIRLGVLIDSSAAQTGARAVTSALGQMQRAAGGVDRMFGRLKAGMGNLRRTLFNLKTAIAGVGLGLLAKSFINAASVTEQFQVRLQVLLGSVGEGNRLFEEMASFASRVPFELEEIMSASTQLAGIMRGGVDEITKWMPLIGDLAAVSGLGIQKTTEQVSRMLSAGAASADLFRERGINAMLGFQAGVAVSAEETRKRLMDAWTSTTSQFRGATELLAQTWEGTMSMLSDKWFQFRNQIMKAGLFDYIKSLATLVDQNLGEALSGNEKAAKKVSDGIIEVFESLVVGTAGVVDAARGPLEKIKALVNSMIDGFNSLPTWAKEVGIIGALLVGIKGKALIAGALVVVDQAMTKFKQLKGIYDLLGDPGPQRQLQEQLKLIDQQLGQARTSGQPIELIAGLEDARDRTARQLEDLSTRVVQDIKTTKEKLKEESFSILGLITADAEEGGTGSAVEAAEKALRQLHSIRERMERQREEAAKRVRPPQQIGGDEITLDKGQMTSFERLRDRLDEAGAAARGYAEGLILINKAQAAGVITDQTKLDLTEKLKKELLDSTEAGKRNIELQERSKQLLAEIRNPAQQYRDVLLDLNVMLKEGWINQEQFGTIAKKQWEDIKNKAKQTTDEMSQFTIQAARNMESAMGSFFFDIMQGNFDNLGNNFKSTIDRMVSDLMASQLTNFLLGDFGNTGQVGGAAGDLFKSIAGAFQGRASGGPTEAFEPKWVGEHGKRELFIPRTAGQIVPEDKVGGSVVVQMTVVTPDANSFRRSEGQIGAGAALAIRRAQRNL